MLRLTQLVLFTCLQKGNTAKKSFSQFLIDTEQKFYNDIELQVKESL